MLALVGLLVSPVVVCFIIWLAFCMWTQHRLPSAEAREVIEAAGKWFPLRVRAVSPSAATTPLTAVPAQREDRVA